MTKSSCISEIIDFFTSIKIFNKEQIIDMFVKKFNLTKDRKVYYNNFISIRFSFSKNGSFSNTVLSLSALQKFDDRPFFVALISPVGNQIFLANTSFLSKISHSSHQLRINNIKGSFNGSDIMKNVSGVRNVPTNFKHLYFDIHVNSTFEENLERLVESTNNIEAKKIKFNVGGKIQIIMSSVDKSIEFINSRCFKILQDDLDDRVKKHFESILTASYIDNVKTRGQIIEYLIASNDEDVKTQLYKNLKSGTPLPTYTLHNGLGDYHKKFDNFDSETDIKVKVLIFGSAPKGYNLDKFLEFLSENNSVFLFYFVGVDQKENDILPKLVSVFDKNLLNTTHIQFHWAGRNSRGVTQFDGSKIEQIILSKDKTFIDKTKSLDFLKKIIDM